ncbi:MAG TPA: PUA domain-containing protein [Nitrososphaerales archaeon]|nr:PUA domain-containing protein [Nitrososphaerales archaeon]
MQLPEDRRLAIMVDYLYGRGVSRALPKDGIRLVYSRRSGRVKLAYVGEKLFATVKPNGSMALSLHGASILVHSRRFLDNCVVVKDDAVEFVRGGKSVFCKFVAKAGANIHPKSEVVVLDRRGRVLGVGLAVMGGRFMTQFKTGVAAKVREGLPT